jgi:hypothetical protein
MESPLSLEQIISYSTVLAASFPVTGTAGIMAQIPPSSGRQQSLKGRSLFRRQSIIEQTLEVT